MYDSAGPHQLRTGRCSLQQCRDSSGFGVILSSRSDGHCDPPHLATDFPKVSSKATNMYAKHFQKEDLADTTVSLRVHDPTRSRQTTWLHASATLELKRFPAHKVLLSTWSDKFDAQVSA